MPAADLTSCIRGYILLFVISNVLLEADNISLDMTFWKGVHASCMDALGHSLDVRVPFH